MLALFHWFVRFVQPATAVRVSQGHVDVPLVRKERMVLLRLEMTTHALHVQPDIPLQAQARLELWWLRAMCVLWDLWVTESHVQLVVQATPLQALAPHEEQTNLYARSVRLVIIPAMATHQGPTRAAMPALQATVLPTQVLPVYIIAARHSHHIIASSRLTTMSP